MSSILEQDLREMNAALLVSSVHQHELREQAEQAEIALRESEARYRTLFNLGPVAIYSCDAAGVIQKFNRRAAELWGREPQLGGSEQRFCGSFKLFLPDGRALPIEHCPMVEVLSGKLSEARNQEVVIERPDGSRVTTIVNIRPMTSPSGEILGAISSFYDISDRKQAEQALRESNTRFETLFDASPVGMYLVDAELRFQQASREARSVFGDLVLGNGEDLVGRDFVASVHILWPPAIADEIVARFRHTLASGKPYIASEFSEVRYDRQVREYYAWQIHRIDLPNGEYGVVCYFIDISARVLAEAAVRASEIRYRRLFEASQDGILMVDVDHFRIIDANPFMLNLMGCPSEELIGKELWEIGLLSDADASRAMVRGLQDQGYVRYDDLPLETAAGRRIQVEVIANLYEEDQQSVIQCNVRDITQRRDLERQASEQADVLAEVSRNKDEFLATLAHELRNPLAPIRNAVQLLGLEDLAELDASLARSMIDRQVTVMVRLIDDLLDVSRISRNMLDIRKQRVDLAHVVASAVESSRPLVAECGHELTISLPPQPVHLDADPVRLAQIILNLLNNAAKYTPPRGHIWLTASRDGSDAVVSVRDNGAGIPSDMLARIFDMFTQVDRSLTQSQGGLGIGLTLVRRLVEMHGGSIEVRSPGSHQGSEFIVRLPLPAQPHQEPQAARVAPRAKALSGYRILVVDDNKDSADSLAMVLRRKDNEIRIAYDGPEAVKAAEAFRPELVLLDIGLPKLNGYEVARRIRQHPWGRDVIIVALTGWGQDKDRRRSQEAGFDLHIVKPVELTALENLLAGR